MRKVTREEYAAFVANYPRNLTSDVCGISEPPLESHNDFAALCSKRTNPMTGAATQGGGRIEDGDKQHDAALTRGVEISVLELLMAALAGQQRPIICGGVNEMQSHLVTVVAAGPPIFQTHPQKQRVSAFRNFAQVANFHVSIMDEVFPEIARSDHTKESEMFQPHFLVPQWRSEALRAQAQQQLSSGGLPKILISKVQLGISRERRVVLNFRINEGNVRPKLSLLRFARKAIGFSHGFGSFASILDGLTGQLDLPVEASGADGRNDGSDHRPPCRVTSGICGLPLSAKIAATIVLSWLAWLCQDRAIELFDGLRGRRRNRWRALSWFSLGGGFFGLVFAAWLWGGTY